MGRALHSATRDVIMLIPTEQHLQKKFFTSHALNACGRPEKGREIHRIDSKP